MHPVLFSAVHALADEASGASLAEVQVAPRPGASRWCGQQVFEHLILTFLKSQVELKKRLKNGKVPVNQRSTVQWIIKAQLCWFGSMSHGIPAPRSLRPREWVPQDGATLATRLLVEAETLDALLVDCRREFGLQPCGDHPTYGPLRVEEWRTYHAVHTRHHLQQFRDAVSYARRHPELIGIPAVDAIHVTADGEFEEDD